MSHIAAAKARYAQNRYDACIHAAETLRPHIGVNFRIAEFSLSTLQAIKTQWGTSQFDWTEIHRRFNDPDSFKFGIWVDDRLCGVAAVTTTGQSVKLQFIEGSPHTDCPLKGRRILIALEAAANYGQRRGKKDLILEPLNETLISLYEDVYGFDIIRPKKGTPYCSKGI